MLSGSRGYASVQSIQRNTIGVAQNGATSTSCKLGETYEARSNCVAGAAKEFILHYHSDARAKELCESFDVDLPAMCLRAVEDTDRGIRTHGGHYLHHDPGHPSCNALGTPD